LRSTRVLIVDDDPSVRRALAREVRSDFDVVVAPSFDAAIAELDGAEPFLAVVSDYEFGPGKDGLDLLAIVAERTPQVVRILISATCEAERIEQALADGVAHRFLPKPWPPGEVLATLIRFSRSGTMRSVRESTRPAASRRRT
jgi:DNA-binding NtrC family response regulator